MAPPNKNKEASSKGKSLGGCDRCGKLVVLSKFTLCYDCRRLERIEMDKALEFLKTHKGASLNLVADATGVHPDLVLKLVQMGRMENRHKDLKDKIRKLNLDS
jgi:hypothetical protein